MVRGLRVAYRRCGRGDPVVLLHGGLSDSREWDAQIRNLSRVCDVIAVDTLGCGGSADPPEAFRLGDHTDVLAESLAALNAAAAHIVGLSLGSIFALALYRDHPARVRSLVLAGAYAGWAGSLPPAEVETRTALALATLDQPVDVWGPPFLATVHGPNAPSALIQESLAILRDIRPEASRRLVRTIARADLREVLPTITVPVLLLYGEADQRAPRAVAEQLHSGIAGSKLVMIPGAGHAVHMEKSVEFNAAVRQFLGVSEQA